MMPVGATCKMYSSLEFITADAKVDGWTETKLVFSHICYERGKNVKLQGRS